MSIDLLECYRAVTRMHGISFLDVGVQEGVLTKLMDDETGLYLYIEGSNVSVDFRSLLISAVLSGSKDFSVRRLHRRMLTVDSYASRFRAAKHQSIRDQKLTCTKLGK